MRIKKRLITLIAFLLLVTFMLINNCRIFSSGSPAGHRFLAHRGLAQTFDISSVEWDTNTAAVIYPPEHGYMENTIPSMEAAFSFGADIVELDIRVTKDKELAVFHDYLLDYRTEKKGRVSDYTLAELRELDVGYGYTPDTGKTFPLRGTGVGLLPSFDQVAAEFPGKKFLVHIRDEGPEIGKLLLAKFEKMSALERELFSVYGNDEAIEIIRGRFPATRALSARLVKKAFLDYETIGWTGYVPESIRNMELLIPLEYARYLWGWPEILVERMNSVNTRVVLVKRQGKWTGGFDTREDIERIPARYSGWIWTERIDRVGKK